LALTPGTRLGVYEVTAQIGVGGMGEVYHATDTKLKRQVAIKILPASLAADPDRLARFQREAEVLAALNHPNIAAIYGLEEGGGMAALVMELVEGDDLSQRIARGAIPIDETLPIAKQITEALEAAHEQGIIHRDLKPANIKVRADGTVKVLDFGLAKAMEPTGVMAASNSMSPTITTPAMTQAGMILGTAAYMSPEQARGKTVDKRADIWAFGTVLFEMLTGKRAFPGEDITDTLAAVVRAEPEWSLVPGNVSPTLLVFLRRSLQKDPKQRVGDIRDVRLALDGAFDLAVPPAATVSPSLSRRMRLAWIVASVAVLAAVVLAIPTMRHLRETAPASDPVHFTIAPPENTSFGGPVAGGTGTAAQLAVSPDGRNIVFVAGAESAYQIWLRPVAALGATPIPGTEGGTFPFWSPDSRFIGFFSAGKLKKVQIAGGPPIVLCDAPFGRGGSWSRDNVILFAPGFGAAGLRRVSSAGGVPTVVTTIDPTTGEDGHRWPRFLPDGQRFFYTAITGACCPASKPARIRIGSLDPAEAVITLLQAESSVSYASGYLLFARDDTLMAQPFDPDARQPTGEAFPLAEYVSREGSRYVGAAVSENGILVYGRDDALATTQLTWFDRAGRALATLGEAARYENFALSPDERRVAVTLGTGSPNNRDIWIIDIARNVRSRLTVDPGTDGSPVWSPDGTRIAFEGSRSGTFSLRQQLINGTAADEELFDGSDSRMTLSPSSWSADARFIAYTLTTGNFPPKRDVWVLPLFGDRKPFPLAHTAFTENMGVFSPDGQWIAYTSDEGGQANVFVQPFPGSGAKYQVSRDGGSHPVWRADGKELFFLGLDATMMAAPIDATGQFAAGVPQALFPTGSPIFSSPDLNGGPVYAVAKDGNRFLVNARPRQSSVAPLTVVVNWTAAIRK
jgi:Tol biopolymer transport system component